MRRELAAISVLVLLGASASGADVAGAGRAAAARCTPETRPQSTTVIIDGDLYGMVRSSAARYVFGWSGPPVLGLGEAVALRRMLGLRGTAKELLTLPEIVGSDYADGGSIGYFSLACPGRYRATVVVHGPGQYRPKTRFWLRDERSMRSPDDPQAGQVLRAFCMPPVWIPNRGRLSVAFTSPLASTAPVFEVDRNGDGKTERHGSFRRGGGGFPGGGAGC